MGSCDDLGLAALTSRRTSRISALIAGLVAFVIWPRLIATGLCSTWRSKCFWWIILFCLSFCSMLFGNLYIYLDWNGRTEIPGRIQLDWVLLWLSSKCVMTMSCQRVLGCGWTWSHAACLLSEVLHFNGSLSDSSRRTIFLSLFVTSVLGTLSFLVLRKSRRDEEMLSEEEGQSLLSTRVM